MSRQTGKLEGLGFSARLRNYWDLSESANLEVSASAITGRVEQPFDVGVVEPNAINVRQSIVGADLTFRWRPLQQGLYKSFIAQVEVMRQVNERDLRPGIRGSESQFRRRAMPLRAGRSAVDCTLPAATTRWRSRSLLAQP